MRKHQLSSELYNIFNHILIHSKTAGDKVSGAQPPRGPLFVRLALRCMVHRCAHLHPTSWTLWIDSTHVLSFHSLPPFDHCVSLSLSHCAEKTERPKPKPGDERPRRPRVRRTPSCTVLAPVPNSKKLEAFCKYLRKSFSSPADKR